VDLFFTVVELAERALAVAKHGDNSARSISDTHPPTTVRRSTSRRALEDLSSNDEQLESTIGLARGVELVGDLMWEHLEPGFKHRHERGERPSRIWGD
jgi:hypothetical protein